MVIEETPIALASSFCVIRRSVLFRFNFAPSNFSDMAKDDNRLVIKSQQNILKWYNGQVFLNKMIGAIILCQW